MATQPGNRTILLGGTAALSDAVEQSVPDPTRVSGGERTATAAAIATQLWQVASQDDGRRFVVMHGGHPQGWAFGLAAAGVSSDAQAPVVLVDAAVSTATAQLVGACGTLQVDLL